MKYIKQQIAIAFAACTLAMFVESCGRAGGNFTGREYMPDMAHSVGYEAGVYTFYNNNRWGGEDGYREWYNKNILGAKPVKGTIARGQKVYGYVDTEEDRARAIAEITSNPLRPKTEEEFKGFLAKGKNLYTIYCSSCHGEKGDGNGVLWANDAPYTAKPKTYLGTDFTKDGNTEGRFYHAIMYGKNVMLSHADKLNDEERWMVIHYIRTLQAAGDGTKYDFAAALKGGAAAPIVAPVDTATTTPTVLEEKKVEEKKDDKKKDKSKKKGSR